MFGHSVNRRNEYFVIFAQVFVFSCFFNTDNHRHLFTFFLIVMRENMAKIRVGGENWWKSCFFVCFVFFSKHKSISTAVLFCIIVGGGYSRKVFRLRSFFDFFKKSLKKDGIRSWFFIGKYRRISSGCSSVFKVVHTSRGAEPWPNQPGTSSHSFLQLKKKNQTHLSSFHFSKKNEINWCDCQLQKETSLYWINCVEKFVKVLFTF